MQPTIVLSYDFFVCYLNACHFIPHDGVKFTNCWFSFSFDNNCPCLNERLLQFMVFFRVSSEIRVKFGFILQVGNSLVEPMQFRPSFLFFRFSRVKPYRIHRPRETNVIVCPETPLYYPPCAFEVWPYFLPAVCTALLVFLSTVLIIVSRRGHLRPYRILRSIPLYFLGINPSSFNTASKVVIKCQGCSARWKNWYCREFATPIE